MNILDIFFPSVCIGCSSLGSKICEPCLCSLRSVDTHECLSCGNKLTSPFTHCLQCEGKREVLQILSFWLYESTMKKAIWSFKYKQNRRAIAELCFYIKTEALAHLLLLKNTNSNTVFIPVPLHPNKERERGYNQSAQLALLLSAMTGIPTAKDAVLRRKETQSQTRCSSRAERASNVRGAFQIAKPTSITQKRVIIVDDVVTTGSTAREIARELGRYTKITPCVVCLAREELNEK